MISLVGVAKHYGERVLFSGVNLTLGISERVGLVGANGSGKTTLLEILAGNIEPDEGSLARNRRATFGYLRQETPKYTGRTLIEEMLAGHGQLDHLRGRIALVEEEMRGATDPHALEALAREHGELERRFDSGGGYDLPTQARRILGGLAFRESDLARATSEFSGGWLMRLALARLLLIEPDLLLLDEPTNYLDLESVVWLEEYLRTYDGSIVVVSHDRALLNALTTRTLELAGGKVVSYAGNYDAFARARALREQGLEAARKAQEREIAHAEAFIERFRAKNTKARQVQSRIKRLEKIERIETTSRAKTMRIAFPEPPPSARVQIELIDIWKGYGGAPVYAGIALAIERGERIALVGPNGAGKSTLMKLVAGVLAPDRGERRLGRGVTLGYYAQHQVEALDYRRTILEEVCDAAPSLSQERVRSLLGRFLFSGDDVQKTIAVLSGGEKSRVALSKLLANPPNVILLDEPTSHLDIPSRDRLQEALSEYSGSIVMISHDRHFLEGLATRVIDVTGGVPRSYLGEYRYYVAKRTRDTAAEATAAAAAAPRDPLTASTAPERARRSKEERRREAEVRNARYRAITPVKRDVERVEAEIDRLSRDVASIEARMADPAFYQDGAQFGETLRSYHTLKETVEAKTRRWEELLLRLEQLERELSREP